VLIDDEAGCHVTIFYCLLGVSTSDSEFLKEGLALS